MAETEELAREKFEVVYGKRPNNYFRHMWDEAFRFYLECWQAAYASGKRDGAPKWIPVEDRLPEVAGTYLVTVYGLGDDGEKYTVTLACDWSPENKRWYALRGWGSNEVTHWQALP
jgi:hypothetical protein